MRFVGVLGKVPRGHAGLGSARSSKAIEAPKPPRTCRSLVWAGVRRDPTEHGPNTQGCLLHLSPQPTSSEWEETGSKAVRLTHCPEASPHHRSAGLSPPSRPPLSQQELQFLVHVPVNVSPCCLQVDNSVEPLQVELMVTAPVPAPTCWSRSPRSPQTRGQFQKEPEREPALDTPPGPLVASGKSSLHFAGPANPLR